MSHRNPDVSSHCHWKYVLETEPINIPSLPPPTSSAFRATDPVPDVFFKWINNEVCTESLNYMAKLNDLISKNYFV
jgi:hypothetical protein